MQQNTRNMLKPPLSLPTKVLSGSGGPNATQPEIKAAWAKVL